MNNGCYEIIDYTTWRRRELFEFFSAADQPFYNLAYRLDVTRVHEFAKANCVSFYLALTCLVTRAMNSVEAFRYAKLNGEIVLFRERVPSFTDMSADSELFRIVTVPCEGSVVEFCREAKRRSEAQRGFIDMDAEGQNLIYISSLPWLDLTSLSHERHFDPDDAIPRVSWGRFTDDGSGRKILGMTLELNHRFVDGYHVALFDAELRRLISLLP